MHPRRGSERTRTQGVATWTPTPTTRNDTDADPTDLDSCVYDAETTSARTRRAGTRTVAPTCGGAAKGGDTARHGKALQGWYGRARLGKHVKERQGGSATRMARQGTARHGMARQGTTRQGMTARQGSARHGKVAVQGPAVTLGSARHGKARQGASRHGRARQGMARQGTARRGKSRLGTAQLGTARRHGKARPTRHSEASMGFRLCGDPRRLCGRRFCDKWRHVTARQGWHGTAWQGATQGAVRHGKLGRHDKARLGMASKATGWG